MNIIQTAGDLKKVLSVYADDLPLCVLLDHERLTLNNDTQIYQVSNGETVTALHIHLLRNA